ncbi:MAG: MMPL family transporter [Deltaproteobacteria bacterium]|nr:MMPL family transporter [Deltaproteobacteria bacterium]
MARLLRLAPLLALLLTIASLALVPRLRLSGRLASLFPDDPAAKALGAYVDAFGGGDVTIVLVRGDDPRAVEAAADDIARSAIGRPGVRGATTSVAAPAPDPDAPPPDPTIAWAFADDEERKQLAQALSDADMKERLEETRALLLMPGSSGLSTMIKGDPLRLLSIVRGRARTLAATASADESGALVADEGRARFVLVNTVGSALDSDDAKRLVDALEGAIADALPKHPGVRASIAGGAAIARDVERMIRHDLYLSSALSTVLVAVAFVVTFRRARALLAIGPPLLLGTLWTTAVAAMLPGGITAIAMGFASVVIGVGLDTGVHVYAGVERARLAAPEAPPHEIGQRALREVARPTLTAAIAAGLAFGAMALSRLPALRQLGLLCAVGEVLTALAILALTPAIAARLERRAVERPTPRALERLAASAASPRGGRIVLAAVACALVAFAILGPPRTGEAIVALKPKGLPSLVAQEEAIRLSAGTPGEVQLTITQTGRDPDSVLARAERLSRALGPGGPRTVESIAPWLPSRATIEARLAERDRLGLAGRADALSRLLGEVGFAIDPFAPALAYLRKPATVDDALSAVGRLRDGPLAPLAARHVARHPTSGESIVATYVRGPGLDPAALAREIAGVDPDAVVTGYPVLEQSLRAALARDLPRVALVALILVAIALRSVLKSGREVIVALVALAVELLAVALAVRVFHVRVHVYDALVLPVLVGITVDESMFLLHALREGGTVAAIRREGRAIVTTALTTACGFAALLTCGFPGLRDLGMIGVLGTVAGLCASLIIVPATARLLGGAGEQASRTTRP